MAGELSAVFRGLAKDATQAATNIARSVAAVTEQAAARQEANIAKILENEAKIARSFTGADEPKLPQENVKPSSVRAEPKPAAEPPAKGGGQQSEGNAKAETGRTDPVDVVSGQMITMATDLVLPGLLPLVLRRAYASGYRGGRLFGPGWASTLDQRVTIDRFGIHFAGDDAQTLHYPKPSTVGEAVYPEDGARWPLRWDRLADVIRIEDPARGWTWEFAISGVESSTHPLTALYDRNGHRIDYLHDRDGVPSEVRHNGGYRVAVDRVVDGPPRIGRLRLLDGTNAGIGTTVVTFGYDPVGRLTGITDASGVPYAYEYDDANRIVSRTDRNGWRYEYQYDERGRVERGIGRDGYLSATFRYDVAERITTVIDNAGHPTRYRYDRYNHIVATTDPLGNTTVTEFDRYGQLLLRTDPLGNTTSYVRDEHGDPVAINAADGARIAVTYAECRMPSRIENPDGGGWRHEYGERGNLLSTVDPLGAAITCGYDERGHLARQTDASGRTWRYESNGAGRPLSVTNPAGAVTRYEYDAFGRVIGMIAPNGEVSRFGWTTQGKLAWQLDPTGTRREMSYDPQGNLVSSRNEAGATTLFEPGPFDRLAARTGPDGARYVFGYDADLRLASVTNPSGARWTYEYDAAGNLVAETDFAGRTVTYRFDAAGQQVGRVDATGVRDDVSRDAAGRILAQRVGDELTEFRYDVAGRLAQAVGAGVDLTFERDLLGRSIAETVDGLTVTSTYDELGRRTGRTTPHGVHSAWRYAATGWESQLVGTGGQLSFEYNADGRETSRQLGTDVLLTQAYDDLGRLAEQQILRRTETPGFGAIQRRAYRYRADGVVAAISDELRGGRNYELTPGGRVTAVNAATWRERYAYDVEGSLVETAPGRDHDAAGPVVFDGALPRAAGRVGYEYDDHGRLVRVVRRTLSGQRRIWTYTWHALNRLTAVSTPEGQVWHYVYDPLGRRVAKHRLDQDGKVIDETRFVWDGAELVEQRHTDAAVVTVTTWDYRTGTGQPLAQTTRSWLANAPQDVIDTRFHAIVTDLVGAPAELVGTDGRIAWRQTTSLWGLALDVSSDERTDCPLRFPGQYHDLETGLHYNYFRYYDPATGRYVTPDPLGLAPAPNQYGYVSNPLTVSDPLGLGGTRNDLGQFARDPNAPQGVYNRDNQYPHSYDQATHDALAAQWTDEGVA
ncbi:MAG TPA: RHS repeat-associated core domain-containing protein, partial [Pseudonocardiaceae bacterium]